MVTSITEVGRHEATYMNMAWAHHGWHTTSYPMCLVPALAYCSGVGVCLSFPLRISFPGDRR